VVIVPTLAELQARSPLQQPTWPDREALGAAVQELKAKPPLVFAGECDDLRASLAKVAAGQAFLLQGGDCAETFEGVTAENVRAKLQVLLQMAVSTPNRGPTTSMSARASSCQPIAATR